MALPLTTSPTAAQEQALDAIAPGNAVLNVTGKGEITKAPDVARFSVAVFTTGSSAQEALEKNTAAMKSVFTAVRELGFADRDVQTTEVGVNPIFERNNQSQFSMDKLPKITGYTAGNTLQLTQRNLENFGDVIDRLIAAGANAVQGPTFGLDDRSEELDAARVKAVKDAQRKAKFYAEAANMRIARILVIDDTSRSGAPSSEFGFYQAIETGVPIAQGEIDISASVDILFELTPR